MALPAFTRTSTVVTALLVLASATAGCADEASPPTAPAPVTSVAPPAEPSPGPSSDPSSDPAASGLPSAGVPPPSAAAQVGSAQVGAAAVLPDVEGERLSDAEARLRAEGFAAVQAVDASGAGRVIVEHDNWVILRQRPPAGSTVAPGAVITLGVGKPTDGQDAPSVDDGVVPAVVCRDLQEAQDALRSAGFYLLVPKDGLGEGRLPLVDRNWIVIGQSAPARSTPEPTDPIELTVVKFGEPTGNSGCRS